MKLVLAFLASVFTTYVLAVLCYTQLNLANLIEMGVSISPEVRFEAAIHDLIGMSEVYFPILVVFLLIAFGLAGFFASVLKELRVLFFVMAGLLVPSAIDFLFTFSFWGLNIVQGAHPIAVTRTSAGLLLQSGACAIGSLLFCSMGGAAKLDR